MSQFSHHQPTEQLSKNASNSGVAVDFETFKAEILSDFRLACVSREASLLGRKEVLTGKAKFGIFGDGKELAQIALAKQFRNGDFRSGYYRDQTLMMAIGQLTVQQFFAGLYAHTDIDAEPMSAGRQMGGHFATHSLDENGEWNNLMLQKNSSADISPTAGQMPRLLGLALASKIYRQHPTLLKDEQFQRFSNGGNEVAFGTIGDASTSEGPFWEVINAAGVLQVPMVLSVWDDGYGISVAREKQTTKDNISEILAGFQRTKLKAGYEIFVTKGWDYAHLCQTYEKAVHVARTEHVPVFVHVTEVNQPQGHSTSGSHERYKSEKRLEWETQFDGIRKFKEWILNFNVDGKIIATNQELTTITQEAQQYVRESKNKAWKEYIDSIKIDLDQALSLLKKLQAETQQKTKVDTAIQQLEKTTNPLRKDIFSAARQVLRQLHNEHTTSKEELSCWINQQKEANFRRYSTHLYSESKQAVKNIPLVDPTYQTDAPQEDGRIILRDNYDKILEKYPQALIFGEDAGKIGGVNQTLEGMQQKYGSLRVDDTGIREVSIIGQGIGMAMRGLRPIAEIQYLDYLLYGIQVVSDDLATVQYRTNGRQKAPLIISTRGHRLEGIWHSGSPMGMILNSSKGVHLCVPRNMTKAAGFYNLLLQADEPAIVIEPLNGYRTKEKRPDNIGEFTTPLGIPEIVKTGTDITVVSYGTTFNLCQQALQHIEELNISVELIDVQTLMPFDTEHMIAQSLKKTNRLLIVDEDVSSGATGYMLDKILIEQNGYYFLDEAPVTLSAKDHRPAYGTDGDYFSKPSIDDIIEAVYAIVFQKTIY